VTEPAGSGEGRPETSARARLLFVCTGNTCRSPLAEVIARAEAERRGWTNIDVDSAGTFAFGGQPASATGIEVAAEHDLDLSEHRSTTLDFRQLSEADLVLGMTPEHKEAALHIHPAVRAHVITEYLPVEHPRHGDRVADPIGGGREQYRQTYRVLEAAIRALFDQLPKMLALGRTE
jgi:protein-tyrosine-phosphatase